MSQGRLDGQVAWISGAARGMGLGICEAFAAEGARICVADVDEELGRAVATRLEKRGVEAMFSRCDVGVGEDVRDSIAATVERFGGLQNIVNCAAVGATGYLHEMTEAQWDRLMAINVKSIFFSIKYGVEHLTKHAHSYVVNIGSISSFVAQVDTPAYTTSKGAVLLLSQSIAVDYAHLGLRCNCVCPGISDTPGLQSYYSRVPEGDRILGERIKRVPLNRLIQPAEVGKSVVFLSCEESSGITGTSLTVDGGYTSVAEWNADAVTQNPRQDSREDVSCD
ncbi:MAG: short-chain dehydrogenase [Planctomycetaceae bacterium]|nr:short-chain dehydrogenase [Planctomycetaceae bacterium]